MKRIISFLVCIAVLCSVCRMTCRAYSARCFAVINADTAEVLYSENADTRVPMASTTKIMTALILCERENLSDEITIPDGIGAEGTSIGLKAGDRVSLCVLLYGMLLASGNDAANAAAYAVAGGSEAFVKLMNEKAESLGLKNTHFATPSGLDGDGHYTTAYELALLTREALKNEAFAAACSTESITVSYGTPSVRHTFKNHNRLLREYDDITGVKTGYTSAAGRCLVSSAEKGGRRLICVTLNDKNDWADHRELLDKGYSLLKEKSDLKPKSPVTLYAASGEKLSVNLPELKYYTLKDCKAEIKTALPQIIYLPLKKGEIIGRAYYYFNYKCVKELSITAPETQKPRKTTPAEQIKLILSAELYSI